MGMSLIMEAEIITDGKERRLGGNSFQLILHDYRLFPLDLPLVIKKYKEGEKIGEAIINRLEFTDNTTTIIYKLINIKNLN